VKSAGMTPTTVKVSPSIGHLPKGVPSGERPLTQALAQDHRSVLAGFAFFVDMRSTQAQ
jgi:hypothetical protein